MEAIGALRDLASSRTEDPNILGTVMELSKTVHTLSNKDAKISALWLLSICHDQVPLHAANAVRSVARDIQSEDGFVKLHVVILTIKVFVFHENNQLSISSQFSVNPKISKALLPVLKELMEYVIAVGSRDQLVGSAVRRLAKCKDVKIIQELLNVQSISHLHPDEYDRSEKSLHACIFGNSAVMMSYERPPYDSPHVPTDLGDPKNDLKKNLKTLSSSQSAINRMSTEIVLPAAATKPITSLEDLDLFFAKSDAQNELVHKNTAPINECNQSIKKATIDLTDLC
jgi:hypothetical protein